jgi:hypothetical protein
VFSPSDNILISLLHHRSYDVLKKFDDHVEHVFGDVALEHGDGN